MYFHSYIFQSALDSVRIRICKRSENILEKNLAGCVKNLFLNVHALWFINASLRTLSKGIHPEKQFYALKIHWNIPHNSEKIGNSLSVLLQDWIHKPCDNIQCTIMWDLRKCLQDNVKFLKGYKIEYNIIPVI